MTTDEASEFCNLIVKEVNDRLRFDAVLHGRELPRDNHDIPDEKKVYSKEALKEIDNLTKRAKETLEKRKLKRANGNR